MTVSSAGPVTGATAERTGGPLSGLLVVAVEQAVAAPLATSRMVDAGARVIKIERAEGDFARGYDQAGGGDSSYFTWTNHGKESLVLNIKDPADADLLHRIIGQADVFVQNLAPGALARAGFGSDELRATNSRLITCDISGYGESPEVADKKAYDLLVQAESGLVGISGGPSELGRVGVSIVDIGTGLAAYTAVLEALIARSVSGEGPGVRVSLFDVAAEWMTVPYAQHRYGDGGPTRVGLRHPTIAPYGAYETGDGALTLLSVQNEREWRRLCADVLQRAELVDDDRYASNTARVTNRDALEQDLGAIVAELDAATFRDRLATASIAYGIVSSLDDLVDHVALRTRLVTSSAGATVELPAHPVRTEQLPAPGSAAAQPSAQPAAAAGPVPRLGEHSESIRKEFS